MPTANRGREVHMTSRRDVQNDNRRENGVPSIAYGVREPQLRSGRDLTGGADRSVGREPHASAGRRLPPSTGREPQINSARERQVASTGREQQMVGARDRQGSSGRRGPVDGQSRAQSVPHATPPKVRPMRTGERAEKKLETAQQTLRRPPPATSSKPAAPVRKGMPQGQRTAVVPASQQSNPVATVYEESPNSKLRTCSPPISPPGSQGSPSTVPRVSCSGRSSSPSTVPAVASPNSGPRSHVTSPTSGLHDEPPHHASPVKHCILKEQASPSGAPARPLMECDINSLSFRRPGMYDDRKPATPVSGAENMGVSPMQENISSPGSDQSKDTSVSFNLSPIRRVLVPPSGVGVSHPYSLSSDTLSLRSSLPPASLASAPSSRTTSSAPSRRESMQPPTSEAALPPSQLASEGGDAAGGPTTATGPPSLAAALGGELVSDVAAGGAASNRSLGSVSKVAEMKSFWEKRTRPSIGSGSGADAGADGGGLVADKSRTPGGLRPSSSSWLRCASDMVRRMKHEEKTTSQLTKRLLERLRVEERDVDYGSPTDSSGDTSDLLSPGSGQDEQESPTMQVCKGLIHNTNAMWRNQRQMSKAIIRVLSLDSGRDGAKERGKDVDCPWCGRSDTPGHCLADVEAERCIGVDSSPLPSIFLVDPPCDPCFAKEGVEEGTTPHKVSVKTEMPDLDSHRRASFQSTQQPESEADELLPSPAQGNDEQSACLTDEAEPAREPQPLESPREFDWSKTTKASEDHDHDPAETVPSTVELNSSTEENTPIPESPDRESAADRSAADRSTLSVDDSFMASAPRATEDGMPRSETFLQQIEQCELSKELRIIVPEGMSANRVVSFFYEGRRHEVEVPEGYAINSEVPITIAKRPPLELTHRLSVLRCHAQFQDRGSIVDSLRHGARPVQQEQGSENPMLQAPEFRHRQYLYSLLRGGAMHPLLPYTPEDDGALAETSFTE